MCIRDRGMTLWDAMVAMYEKYGYYKDDIQSITLKGIDVYKRQVPRLSAMGF